jgi:hypothetical protein
MFFSPTMPGSFWSKCVKRTRRGGGYNVDAADCHTCFVLLATRKSDVDPVALHEGYPDPMPQFGSLWPHAA